MNVKSLRLSDEATRGLVHPHTGAPLVPIGTRRDGSPIWPIMGASEDDDENEKDESDDDPADEDDETGDEDDPADGESDEQDDAPASKELVAKNRELIEEKKKARKRAQDAEQRANDLEQRLNKLENKDKPETDLLKSENETLKSENTSLRETLQQSRLENAFLSDNSFEWHNPSHAMRLTDLSDVDIDDDGSVTGLKEALEATAKEYPYLLKENGEPSKKKPPVKTGDKPKSSDKDKQTKAQKDAALRKKYRIGGR